MKARAFLFLLPAFLAGAAVLRADDLSTRSPFGISIATATNDAGEKILRADFTIPQECVLYYDRLHFRTISGDEVAPLAMPKPLTETDKVTGKEKKIYEQNFSVELRPVDFPGRKVAIKFQGCTNDACFFPETRTFAPDDAGIYAEAGNGAGTLKPLIAAAAAGSVDWEKEFNGFRVKGQQTGYLSSSDFISFLGRALSGQAGGPLEAFTNRSLLPMLLIIIFGGLLLNFTPCILPMIPINLAIIGAGSVAQSRLEGFRNGLFYGAGMALAYGALGVTVVLTGAKFGALNSSMWFNLAIAVVFVVMALGMFDVLHIDFTRFSGGGRGGATGVSEKGLLVKHLLILFMGVMSALLAGACVAPVVISVVLLATNFYADGNPAGLLLPFLLGVGMALPWPFAGAGLSFMPKPGRWMVRVKHFFGVVIAGFALYYAHLALGAHLASARMAEAKQSSTPAPAESDAGLLVAIRHARDQNVPLFVDFHASWCKDCSAMDATVFNRDDVQKHLKDFVAVRYAAEQPDAEPARSLLDHFNIVGLPAYLVLSPK
ncbi:MAG TPA: cytochrome c biogenesis protein CcdA [Candidatus Sulfotelmatobacter sp.]|jgi:thiol:disulfide interchange protein DsbD|nr:cytochrome c biogenesis protein CcdA [Candidatus Sulfotelmatobacter sp.]